ncbi:MAG: Dynein intermediate chain 2, axonemal, partial [Paramarteilia canceri]
ANTERLETEKKGMNHTEGGWPKDVSVDDHDQVKRYRKKIEKDESFLNALYKLSLRIEDCIRNRDALDIFDRIIHPKCDAKLDQKNINENSIRTISFFSNPAGSDFTVSGLSWSPGDSNKIAVSYSSTITDKKTNCNSFIIDSEDPSTPLYTLLTHTNCSSIAFNGKDSNIITLGFEDGRIGLYDIRKVAFEKENIVGSLTSIEISHSGPVHCIEWIQAKSGSEFFSAGLDGNIFYWDTRKFSEHIEKINIRNPKLASNHELEKCSQPGISAMEFEPTIPTKLLVGAENGTIFIINRKGKTNSEKLGTQLKASRGYIGILKRNPFYPKYFIVSGENYLSIWSEDFKDGPIVEFNNDSGDIASALWSTTRPGVIFVVMRKGSIEIIDLLESLESLKTQYKVCNDKLSCAEICSNGKKIAVGSETGKLYFIGISEKYFLQQKNEKSLVIQ